MIRFKHLSFACSILFAATLAACAGDAQQRSTGEYIDDSAMTARVKAALIDDPDVSAGEIEVEAYRGHVQLSGFVSSRTDIEKAMQIARDVDGVERVENNMQVRQSR